MRSSLLALAAVLIWSSLALLNSALGPVPPLLSAGIALTIGGLAGLPWVRDWKVPPRTFAVGLAGIFGYHALLFAAFRLAPAVEVNLVNYLWPLLIVLLSPAFLKGCALGARHLIGAVLGFAGAALIAGGGRIGLDAAYAPGYLLAATAALLWAAYSLATKRLPPFPSAAVGGFCLASGLVSLAAYGLGAAVSGSPIAAIGARGWACLVLMGLGPLGGAFYLWDAALKAGDPRVIGSLSYLTPLLSTLLLVLVGGKALSPAATGAMALIVAGAAAGSLGRTRTAGRPPRPRRRAG